MESQSAYFSEYPKRSTEAKKMDNELYSFALKNTIQEIQNICPDITNCFIFREDGEPIAKDQNTPEKTMTRIINSFDGILKKADAIGRVDGMTIESVKGRVNVSCVDNLYIVTVTSKNADKNYVSTVTRVLIPTVLKLLERLTPAPLNNPLQKKDIKTEPTTIKGSERSEDELTEESWTEKPEQLSETEAESETMLPEPPVKQFIVENLSGLFAPSDMVRIDSETLARWQEPYEDREIEGVEIVTFGGQSTRCRVKPIKETKHEGRGIIQIPQRILDALEIKKGELVRAKPILE